MSTPFDRALEEYKGEIREAYNFGFNEETNAINLAVKAARWARAFTQGECDATLKYERDAKEAYRENMERLEAEIDQLRSTITPVHEECVRLEAELKEANNEVERLASEVNKCGDCAHIDRLTKENTELRELAHVTGEETYRAKAKVWLSEIDELRAELERYRHIVDEEAKHSNRLELEYAKMWVTSDQEAEIERMDLKGESK